LAIVRMSLDLRSAGLFFVSGVAGLLAFTLIVSTIVLARPGWIGAALGLLALDYIAHVLLAGQSDLPTLGLVSVALLLVGELSQWSIDSRLPGRYVAGLHRSRAIGIGALVAAGLGIVLVSSVAVGLPTVPGGWIEAVAVAATVTLLALISVVALRAPSRLRR
jgi:hypothetical protein